LPPPLLLAPVFSRLGTPPPNFEAQHRRFFFFFPPGQKLGPPPPCFPSVFLLFFPLGSLLGECLLFSRAPLANSLASVRPYSSKFATFFYQALLVSPQFSPFFINLLMVFFPIVLPLDPFPDSSNTFSFFFQIPSPLFVPFWATGNLVLLRHPPRAFKPFLSPSQGSFSQPILLV